MRRDKLSVIIDILDVANSGEGVKPTHILYRANLSYKLLTQYINMLRKKGLVKETDINGKKHIKITDKGKLFLSEARKMKRFMESFGL